MRVHPAAAIPTAPPPPSRAPSAPSPNTAATAHLDKMVNGDEAARIMRGTPRMQTDARGAWPDASLARYRHME